MLKNKFLWMWLYNPPLILLAIVGIHLGWIYGLHADNPTVLNLASLSGISIFLENGVSVNALMWILIVASVLAVIGIILEPVLDRPVLLGLLFGQYILVFVAMTSDAYVLITGNARIIDNGHYINRHVDSSIVIPLLFGLVWISFLHTYAILQRYVIAYRYHRENYV